MNIGFENRIPHWRVAAILIYKGSAAKRKRDEAHKAGKLMDATYGRRTRSMVVTDADQVILSSVHPETLMTRLSEARKTEKPNAH